MMAIQPTFFQLEQQLLAAMYNISSILNSSLSYSESSNRILKILHDDCQLHCGMLTVFDHQRDLLTIHSVHSPIPNLATEQKQVCYKVGEGIVGEVLRQGNSVVIRNLGRDLRFADKLALYDYNKPFICVPLKTKSNQVIGALSAQPPNLEDKAITILTRFLDMIANLVAKQLQQVPEPIVSSPETNANGTGHKRKNRNHYNYKKLVGHTRSMRQIFEQIRLVSRWDSTVLLRGESGTGKELVANAIHYNSPRANNPFVKLNCAALPDNLLESELFGHEKGAFTGAVRQRKGRFEMANNGTIFLDEIGETSAAFQAKLLRVLQEKEFERVGGTDTIAVNVRIIAATNRNLEEEVANYRFREDLYYRLNVMPMHLPALRERMEDIPELAEFMTQKLSQTQRRDITITDSAIRLMMDYSWPGNVRELENTLERAAVLSESGVIKPDLIRFNQVELHPPGIDMSTSMPLSAQTMSMQTIRHELPRVTQEKQFKDEREMVIDALERSGWVKAKAARLLNMTPRQIAYRIQIMNIEMKQI
jgi:Nif-specific regulatory protein